MSVAMVILYLGLFAMPWTAAGLIHSPIAGVSTFSRKRILLTGLLVITASLLIASWISVPPTEAVPPENAGAGETLLASIWLISCAVWPFCAAVASTKAKAKARAYHGLTGQRPIKGESAKSRHPAPLTNAQRASLGLPLVHPQKPSPAVSAPASRAVRNGWSMGEAQFTYMDAEGDITSRTVTVHSITSTYLKGLCHDRGAERTFRLDRIIGAVVDVQTGEILVN